MKALLKLLIIALLATGGISTANVAKSQVTASVSLSVFHENLRPYGRWVNHSRYGEVWIPHTSGFRPYSTGGHWAYTDYGWTWVSDYDWGWAPFHYGRWAYDPGYGWVWVPGYEWGPAWVSWRTGGDYYGWAPLSPDISIGIGVSFGSNIPYDRWVFAPRRYITSPYVSRYYVPRTKNVTIIRNTTIINNTREANFSNNKIVVVGGPRREDVERTAHIKVQVMHVNNSSRPGRESVDRSNNTVNIYRPVINKTTVNKTVVNNNNTEINKTTVNKNSNNKTVNKNTEVNKTTNNTEVNKNKNTTVNKNSNNTDVNKNNKTVNKNTQVQKKPGTNNNNNNTKPAPVKKPTPKPNNKPNNNPPNNDNNNNDKDKKPQGQADNIKDVQPDRDNNPEANRDQVQQRAKARIEAKRDGNNSVVKNKNNHPNPKPRRPQ